MKRTFALSPDRALDLVVLGSRAGRVEVQVAGTDGEPDTQVTAQLRAAPGGDWLVEIDGVTRRVSLSVDAEVAWIDVGGATGSLARTARCERVEQRRGRAVHADNAVRSPMTGRVVALPVAVGDTVARGDVLVVVEAMKMEQPLKAPRDGVVAAIHAAVGELVDGGVELVVLAADVSASAAEG